MFFSISCVTSLIDSSWFQTILEGSKVSWLILKEADWMSDSQGKDGDENILIRGT